MSFDTMFIYVLYFVQFDKKIYRWNVRGMAGGMAGKRDRKNKGKI